MASRLPSDEEEANAVAAAAAFQSALAQQVRPLLGWDPLSAMTTMHRNLIQQQQQQQQHNSAPINQPTAAAMAASAAASLTPQQPLPTMPALWPYGLQGGIPPPSSVAATAAASLASLGPATSYLNHLQSIHSPESLLSFQQNLLLLEQFQQQRQLLAANPHLLMAAVAAQSSNPSTSSPSQSIQQSNLLATTSHHQARSDTISPTLHATTNVNNSLLSAVNPNLSSRLTNQHQDSLVDQHFRRSLGEDYNQIMSSKGDKINVGK